MSATLKYSFNASYTSNNSSDYTSFAVPGTQYSTVQGSDRIGMSAELISSGSVCSINTGSLTSIGYLFVNNIDISSSITIGPDGTNWPIVLAPKEFAFFKSNNWGGLYVNVTTGSSALINYSIFEK